MPPQLSSLPIYIINAFVDPNTPQALNTGNPAAVVLLSARESGELSDTQRQSIATELNLSETSFVTRTSEPLAFQLRWFTPAVEVALCGHATLAAAEAVLQAGWVQEGETITFITRKAGDLQVEVRKDEQPFEMHFPLLDRRDQVEKQVQTEFCTALGVEKNTVEDVFKSDYDTVVLVNDEDVVRELNPNFDQLKLLETRGVLVAAKGKHEGIVSRFFAPIVGIQEDPVTGSAHCILAAVYVKEGETVKARQLSKRGGVVMVGRVNRTVNLGGMCRVVIAGEVRI